MAITIRRILIDRNGQARFFYADDQGPPGHGTIESADSPELRALIASIKGTATQKATALASPAGREAARSERTARAAARGPRPR